MTEITRRRGVKMMTGKLYRDSLYVQQIPEIKFKSAEITSTGWLSMFVCYLYNYENIAIAVIA